MDNKAFEALLHYNYRHPDLPSSFNTSDWLWRFYIRLDTPSYRPTHGVIGFAEEADKMVFENTFDGIFRGLDFAPPAIGDDLYKKPAGEYTQILFLHPDAISGVASISAIRALAAAIEDSSRCSSIRWIDLYERFAMISEMELRKRLHHYEAIIRQRLFSRFQTTRRTKYRQAGELVSVLDQLPGVALPNRNVDPNGVQSLPALEVVTDILNRMIREGLIEIIRLDGNRPAYRSLNKTELKKARLTVPTVVDFPLVEKPKPIVIAH